MRFKLANVLLRVDEFLEDHPDLLYHATSMARYEEVTDSLAFSGRVDFLTYFNALSLAKWRKYTDIDNLQLHLELVGDPCRIGLMRAYRQVGEPRVETVADHLTKPPDDVTPLSIDIDIDIDDAVLVGFSLETGGTASIRNAFFATDVDEGQVRRTHLALCTTTFRKEEYILPNIEMIRNEVIESDEPIADAIHLFVVDNGRTLDAAKLTGGQVTVCPNPNVGGSGGFARGMLEALHSDEPFTHVILMDDDVRVFPESFKRTFNLLSLRNEGYADAFISGAMLELQNPDQQFEDVSYTQQTGGYHRVKDTMDLSQLKQLVLNETTPVEPDNAYGAWWYNCIPIEAIRANGLPMPFFVRCDDVEYGVRCGATYMTMGGICVWHSRFEGRFKASVDGYQYVRNFLVTLAVTECSSEAAFLVRYWRTLSIFLRTMNYEAADLWLDGLEDYLKGPQFLATADGSRIMREKGAKNEVLVPIEQLDPQIMSQVTIRPEWLTTDSQTHSLAERLLMTLPHDRHLMPSKLLRSEPTMIFHSGNCAPWHEVAMRDTLVALDATGTKGHIRRLDRARYRQLVSRYHALLKRYHKTHRDVAESYREAYRYLTSEGFWRSYLELAELREAEEAQR